MSGMDNRDRWVCPNDRELTLRAKLQSGWSVKGSSAYANSGQMISETENEAILEVLRRAQQVEIAEKNRIGRLIDRLNNMKRNAKGDGNRYCGLCNDEFGLFGAHCHTCKDCKKAVCSKCGVDTFTSDKEPLFLCKICSETREMWKKSGAWFFNAMPKFPLSYPPIVSRSVDNGDTASSDGRNESTSSNSISPQVGYQKSHLHSPNVSPVIRRKARSPSPRKYRFGVTNNHTENSEFGAAIEAGHSPVDDTSNGDELWNKRFAQHQ